AAGPSCRGAGRRRWADGARLRSAEPAVGSLGPGRHRTCPAAAPAMGGGPPARLPPAAELGAPALGRARTAVRPPRHITHVVENLNRGGLERVVIELVRAQREAGHECRVVCLFEPGSLAPELQDSGVEVQACGKRTGPDVVALARMRRLLARGGRGVLHSHNAAAHYHAVPAAAGLGFQRIVNTRHSMAGPDRGCRRERLYRRAARFTDAVVAVCDAARAQLADHGVQPRRELLAIPNGVRVDRYAPRHDAARGRLLAALGLPAGNRLLGSVGR